jgi:hypothetical protein
MDKKETKIEKSRGRARTVQERAKNWDELNKKMLAKKARDEALALEKENWVDEEGDEMEEDAELKDAIVQDSIATEVIAQSVPLPEPMEDDEEIL